MRQIREYYRQENNRRLAAAREISPGDTILLNEVHSRVTDLILLSKDTENGSAARVKSGMLFDSLSKIHGLNPDDFGEIGAELSAMEIEIQLLENELAFADRLLMQKDSLRKFIFTAH